MTTVKTLLVVATMQKWITCRMNMIKAFLHGDLQEVYLKVPLVWAAELKS